jgi:hypothetical protein
MLCRDIFTQTLKGMKTAWKDGQKLDFDERYRLFHRTGHCTLADVIARSSVFVGRITTPYVGHQPKYSVLCGGIGDTARRNPTSPKISQSPCALPGTTVWTWQSRAEDTPQIPPPLVIKPSSGIVHILPQCTTLCSDSGVG